MRPKQLSLPGLADRDSDLEGPRLKLKIHPAKDGGAVKGVAMVGIASAITLYPVRIMEGRRGLFAAMPQRQEKSGEWKDVIYPTSREAREYLQRCIVKAFDPKKEVLTYVQGYCHPECTAQVVPVHKAGTNLVAMASITLEDIRVDSLSIYKKRDGSLKIYYPQRRWVENGEIRMADMVLVTDAYRERFLEAVTKEYQRIREEKAAVEIRTASEKETGANRNETAESR